VGKTSFVGKLLKYPAALAHRQGKTLPPGISPRRAHLPGVLIVIAIAILTALAGLSCQPGQSTPPTTSPASADQITNYINSIEIAGAAYSGGTPLSVNANTSIMAHNTAKAEIDFAGQASCALNPNYQDPTYGIETSITTRHDPGFLFRQNSGCSLVVWDKGNTSQTFNITAGVAQDIPVVNIQSGDPAMRLIVTPDRETRVAVFSGSAIVTVTTLKDEKTVREVTANQEVKINLQDRGIFPGEAEFTPAEKEEFYKMADDLGIKLPQEPPPYVPAYSWAVPTDLAPFDNDAMQQAICLILDEESIVNKAFPGETVEFVAEQEWASGKNDPDTARKLMAEAGYPDPFKLDVFVYPANDEGTEKLAAAVLEALSEAGILPNPHFYTSIDELPHAAFSLILKRIR
jgi:hypothetical protein